jgi:hypothetical protein
MMSAHALAIYQDALIGIGFVLICLNVMTRAFERFEND